MTMARRSDHTREELKQLILDKAWKIAGKKGFEGLTARAIAAEAGYAPGTIYNLFKSMDDLILQINARTLDLLYETLSNPACNDPKKSPSGNMKAMAASYMAFARDYRPYWLMLFHFRLPEGRKVQKWYQGKIDALFEPLEKLLTPLFTERQKNKRKMAARVLWSSVHGLCFLQETGKVSIVSGDDGQAGDMAAYLIDTFLAGLKA